MESGTIKKKKKRKRRADGEWRGKRTRCSTTALDAIRVIVFVKGNGKYNFVLFDVAKQLEFKFCTFKAFKLCVGIGKFYDLWKRICECSIVVTFIWFGNGWTWLCLDFGGLKTLAYFDLVWVMDHGFVSFFFFFFFSWVVSP